MKMKLIAFFAFYALASHSGLTMTEAIYGEDDRVDVEMLQSVDVLELSRSVAVQIPLSFLDVGDSSFSFKTGGKTLSEEYGRMLCSGERFASQLALGTCSGFLVGENILLSAGHCFTEYEVERENELTSLCSERAWVFDYRLQRGLLETEDLSLDDLFRCKRIIKARYDEKSDYALIELDRNVLSRKALTISSNSSLDIGDRVFMLGHPLGTPLKHTGNAQVLSLETGSDFFKASLDAFVGNSGSPVFKEGTWEVIGLLTGGEIDFFISDDQGSMCYRSYVSPATSGEKVQDARALIDLIESPFSSQHQH